METNLKEILECEEFEPSDLLKRYTNPYQTLDIEDFKKFIKEYIDEATQFENKTGIPRRYYNEQINLSLFEKSCYRGYANVKDVYIYFNEKSHAIFLKQGKEVARIKKIEDHWMLEQLEKIDIKYIQQPKDPEVSELLYFNDNFTIEKVGSYHLRYYKDSIYDVAVHFKGTFYFFYSDEQIDEYSFVKEYLTETEVLQLRRMLKLKKIFFKNKKTRLNLNLVSQCFIHSIW